ncbi:MFS transporter [Actinomadura alba]|uniref:MFS transporter n=1 Tax=Actinomadura alba TaxID=406431 RepID=A0ABR7LXB3_9ACTN|nr:MFS transporter [Actinomadura alba]MBC6469492.1 MFS transporter [Actinomadura alba]
MTVTGAQLLRGNNAYRHYFLARITSVAGGSVAPIALAYAIIELGGGATGIAVVLGVEYGVWMLMMPLMGILADRTHDLRNLLIVSQLQAAGFQFIEAALILSQAAQVWSLSVVAAGGAAAASMSGLAGNRLLAQIVAPEHLVTANATFRTVQMSVATAGPAAGGFLVTLVGPGSGILWDAVTFLAAAAWFARLPHAPAAPRGKPQAGLAEGWRAFTTRTWLLALVVSEGIGNAAFMSAFIIGPVYAQQNLDGAADWGLINGCLAAGSALGAWLAGRTNLHRAGLIVTASSAAFALGPAAMGLGLGLPVLAGAVLLGGALAGPGDIARRTLPQVKIPNQQLGRVDGHTLLIESLPIPIAYALAGPAADHFGAQPVIGACAVAMVTAALAPLSLREVRHLRLTTAT